MSTYGSPVSLVQYDGKCLVIRGVELNGGKYDIRIESHGGGQIKNIDAIKKFSIEMFQNISNPSQVQFHYTEAPERLEMISEGKTTQCSGELVKAAREIHNLFISELQLLKNDPKIQKEYALFSPSNQAKLSFDAWCRYLLRERANGR